MIIKYADQKIREARSRMVSLDRELAALRRQSYSPRLSRALKQEMREQTARLGEERCRALMDLMELIELAEMPLEYMGSA